MGDAAARAGPAVAVVVLDGATLAPDAVVAAARQRAPVRLAGEARARNARARETIGQLLERGQPLYGASTGVGALRDFAVQAIKREQLQWNLLRSHAVDAGPALPEEVVRAGMVVRANQLGAGGAGVAPELLDGLVRALAREEAPCVRALGSLGTGDLPGLARIALAVLAGEGSDAPGAGGVRLGLRDAVGFLSSNAITAGHACLLAHDIAAVHGSGLAVAALSFAAVAADPVVLAPEVQAARGGAGQAAVAARLRELLGAAGRAGTGAPHSAASCGVAAAAVHPAYPFRVIPQVDGVSAQALAELRRVLARELNARAENALIDAGAAWPNGNFHAADLAAALDALRAALAQSASLIAARISALLEPRISGLTPFLARQPGVESGMMMLEYTGHCAAAEIRSLALPMAAQAVSASLGVESHASLAATSARRLAEQIEPLRVLVASELVVALRALELSGRRPGGESLALYERARRALPTGLGDRPFGDDVQAALALLAAPHGEPDAR
jgi:histidine ammonia-lyase